MNIRESITYKRANPGNEYIRRAKIYNIAILG